MMNTLNRMRYITATLRNSLQHLLAATLMCGLFASCEAIYDDEGDCDVTILAKFRYDRNMKWADAFPSEVTSVNLYAFNTEGILVWCNSESGEALSSDDYVMRLDLRPGDYHLLAWCGLDNPQASSRHFNVPKAVPGKTTLEEMTCRMERVYNEDGASSKNRLMPLFHGTADISVPYADDGETFTYLVPLTKDTNHVRVILQHLNGEPVDVNQFTYKIEEENGFMAHDNSLLPDEMITFRPYHTGMGTASLGIDDYPEKKAAPARYPAPGNLPAASAAPYGNAPAALGDAITADSRASVVAISVAVADLSIPRLVKDRYTFLSIYTRNNRLVARVPLTHFALLLKDGYDHEMTDQEYLDREDDYNLTFFLDEDDYWLSTSVIINSWKLVFNDIDFGDK